MSTRRLSLIAVLLGVSALAGATSARACKYCWSAESAASQYTQQSMLPKGQDTSPPGAFPLDSTISRFQPTGTVVTNAAGLRPASKPSAVAVASAADPSARGSRHYADAGLLGLAAMGGVFCWRTRRKTGSER